MFRMVHNNEMCCLFIIVLIAPFLLFAQEDLSSRELERGRKQFYSSDYEKAIETLSAAIENNKLAQKVKEDARLLLGLSYVKNNQYYLAEEELEEVLTCNPERTLNEGEFDQQLITFFENLKKDLLGSLEISTGSVEAEVYLNGNPRGTTPLAIEKIVAKKYNILLLKNGYKSLEDVITLRPGQNNQFDFALERKENTGHLVLHSVPEETTIYIDSTVAGTTPMIISNIPYGNHLIIFEKKDYIPRRGVFQINDSQSTYLEVELEREMNAFLLSALMPGVGQFQKKRYLHGAFFSGATIGFLGYLINFTQKNQPNEGKPFMSEQWDGYYIGEERVSEEEYRREQHLRSQEENEYLNRKTRIWVVGALLYIANLVDIYNIDKAERVNNALKKPEKFGVDFSADKQIISCTIKFMF